MKKLILLISMIISAFNVAIAGVCTTNVCDAKINLLYVHENTKIYIRADADMSTLNCTLAQSSVVLEKSNPMQSEIYSLLLSAKLTDKEARIRIEEGSNICRVMYVQLLP